MELHGELKHHVYIHSDDSTKELLSQIIKKLNIMAATLDQVLQDTQDESTLDDSIITLLNGINQQLKDALSGATLPPEDTTYVLQQNELTRKDEVYYLRDFMKKFTVVTEKKYNISEELKCLEVHFFGIPIYKSVTSTYFTNSSKS